MSSSNESTPRNGNGNNGKGFAPKAERSSEDFERFNRIFAEIFAKCYNHSAEDVSAMPIENMVSYVKLGKAGGPQKDAEVRLAFPRRLARQFKLPLDDPTRDLMVFVHIPRSAVDFASMPTAIVDASGKKLA